MNFLSKMLASIEEDCGLPSEVIPGLSIYSRNPLVGVRFFISQLKVTLSTYLAIFGFSFFTAITKSKAVYEQSIMGLISLLLCVGYSGSMTFIKYLLFRTFSYLDTSQPRAELKRRFIGDMRKRLYQYNLKITSYNFMFFVISALYSVSSTLVCFFSGEKIQAWPVALCSALALVRHFTLTRKFEATFMSLRSYEMNPYDMDRLLFSTATEGLPDECSICMSEYVEGDRLLRFGCPANHIYHEDCLSKWLVAGQACPICRTRVN